MRTRRDVQFVLQEVEAAHPEVRRYCAPDSALLYVAPPVTSAEGKIRVAQQLVPGNFARMRLDSARTLRALSPQERAEKYRSCYSKRLQQQVAREQLDKPTALVDAKQACHTVASPKLSGYHQRWMQAWMDAKSTQNTTAAKPRPAALRISKVQQRRSCSAGTG